MQRVVLIEPYAIILVKVSPDVPQQNEIANIDDQKTDPYVKEFKI